MKNQIVVDKKAKINVAEMCLWEAIFSLKSIQEVQDFFKDLCTPAEIQALSDRWLVVPAIKAGKPYRKIYEETGVSATTIGRVARSLLLGTGAYNLIYERLKTKKADNK